MCQALPEDKLRELCQLSHVYVCHSEEATCSDSENWSLFQLDRSSRRECSEQSCEAEPEGRVEFACLCFEVSLTSQSHPLQCGRVSSAQQLDMCRVWSH